MGVEDQRRRDIANRRLARLLSETQRQVPALSRGRQLPFSDVVVASVDEDGELVEDSVSVPDLLQPTIDVELLEQDIADAQDRLDEARDELDTLAESTLPGLDSRLADAEAAVDAAEGRLGVAEGELTDLTTNVLPGLTDALDDVQGELSDHAARMSAAEQAVADAVQAVAAAEGELATLRDTTIPELDGRLASAESAVSAVESAVSDAQGDLATLTDTTLPALDTRLGSAESAVSAAEGRLTDAEAELSSLDTELGAVSGNIGDLIGRVGTVESDVSDAQSAASAAQAAASDANTAALEAVGIANGKGRVIYQASAPTGANASANNLWIRTSDNKPHTYNGSTWVAVTDKAATDAASAASAAQSAADAADTKAQSALAAAQAADGKAVLAQQSADGKSTVTYGAAKKASNAAGSEGDTHYVFSGSNLIATQRRTATAWVDAELGHQIIGSVDLGKATVGQLDGQYIKANTVTTNKLLVGDMTNLIPDLIRETGTVFPHVGGAGGTLITQGASADAEGTDPGVHYFAQRDSSAAGMKNTARFHYSDGTWHIPVTPGGTYRFSVLHRLGGTYPNGIGAYRIAVAEYDAAKSVGVYVGYNYISPNWFWREGVTEFTVGPTTAFIRVDFQMNTPDAGYRLAYPTLRRMNAGELVVDGAITGSKIKAGSITATDAVFENGAIQNADIGNLNASKINAGTLDAARIGAGSIDATKISSYNLTTANATIGNSVITNAMIANLNASKINAGTLAAARIGAGSIDATKISSYNLTTANATIGNAVVKDAAIESVNAAKINAGTLDAARIGANSITAEKLVIGSGNLFPDPYFRDTAKWGDTNVSVVSHPDFEVGNALQIVSATVQRGTYYGGSGTALGAVQFEPGKSYRIRVRARVEGAAGSTLRFYVRGRNASGSYSTYSTILIPSSEPVTPAGEVREFESSSLSVGNAIVIPQTVGLHTTAPYVAGTTFVVSDVQMQVVAGATLIEDGAVTTEKVAAEAITGNKIKAGSITASDAVFGTGAIQNADIGNLNASKINAGTLAAARIGAGTIDTTHLSAGAVTSAKITADELTGLDIVGSKFRLVDDEGSALVSLSPGEANFAVFGTADQNVAISSDGRLSAVEVAAEEITYAGESLNVILNDRPKGLVHDSIYDLSDIGGSSTAKFRSIFATEFELEADRAYLVTNDTSGNLWSNASYEVFADMRSLGTQMPGLNGNSSGRFWADRIPGTARGNTLNFSKVFYTRSESPDAAFTRLRTGVNMVRAKVWRGGTSGSWSLSSPWGDWGRFSVIDLGTSGDVLSNGTDVSRSEETNDGSGTKPGGSTSVYTKTYNATWSQSYTGAGGQRSAGADTLYQGYVSAWPAGGTQRSLIGFNDAQIRSDTSGASIEWIEAYVFFDHWWSGAGGTAGIGTHGNANKPSSWTGSTGILTSSSGWPRGSGRWVRLPSSQHSQFQSGAARGISLLAASTASTYYGYARGVGRSYAPKLRIKYRK